MDDLKEFEKHTFENYITTLKMELKALFGFNI